MARREHRSLVLLCILLLAVTVCTMVSADAGEKGDLEKRRFTVFVSILPQKYVVQQIGRPYTDVHVLVQPGDSPATYSPTPRQLSNLGQAKIFFRIGVPFEKAWVAKAQRSTKDLAVVDLRRNIELRHFNRLEAAEDAGQDAEKQTESGKDPHTWLDPRLVKKQTETVYQALAEQDPDHREIYRRNYREFAERLDQLHNTLKETLKPVDGKKMFVFHPAFGYFADAYGLTQVPIELQGKSPSPRELNTIIQKAREEGIQTIFVQKQFSERSARTIARALDGEVVVLNPLPEHYIEGMKRMGRKIAEALKK